MVMFGWDGATTVRVGSITMVIFGVMSSTILLLYIFCHFGKMYDQNKTQFYTYIMISVSHSTKSSYSSQLHLAQSI